jgi:hypothetical protein
MSLGPCPAGRCKARTIVLVLVVLLVLDLGLKYRQHKRADSHKSRGSHAKLLPTDEKMGGSSDC